MRVLAGRIDQDQAHRVERMGGHGAAVRGDHFLGVAVIGRNQQAPAGGKDRLGNAGHAGIHSGHGDFSRRQDAGVPHHVAVGQIDHRQAVSRRHGGQKGVGDGHSTHLGL